MKSEQKLSEFLIGHVNFFFKINFQKSHSIELQNASVCSINFQSLLFFATLEFLIEQIVLSFLF